MGITAATVVDENNIGDDEVVAKSVLATIPSLMHFKTRIDKPDTSRTNESSQQEEEKKEVVKRPESEKRVLKDLLKLSS